MLANGGVRAPRIHSWRDARIKRIFISRAKIDWQSRMAIKELRRVPLRNINLPFKQEQKRFGH
jgi:hypothetical protein